MFSNLEPRALSVELLRRFSAHEITNQRSREPLIGNHAVFNGMAQVHQMALLFPRSWERLRGRTLVWFTDDLLIEDANLIDHEQSEISNDEIGKLPIVDVIAVDVEAEVLPLN